MNIDYWKEFSLNIEHQLKDEKIKEVMQVGYQVDNCICFSILIPSPFLNLNEESK